MSIMPEEIELTKPNTRLTTLTTLLQLATRGEDISTFFPSLVDLLQSTYDACSGGMGAQSLSTNSAASTSSHHPPATLDGTEVRTIWALLKTMVSSHTIPHNVLGPLVLAFLDEGIPPVLAETALLAAPSLPRLDILDLLASLSFRSRLLSTLESPIPSLRHAAILATSALTSSLTHPWSGQKKQDSAPSHAPAFGDHDDAYDQSLRVETETLLEAWGKVTDAILSPHNTITGSALAAVQLLFAHTNTRLDVRRFPGLVVLTRKAAVAILRSFDLVLARFAYLDYGARVPGVAVLAHVASQAAILFAHDAAVPVDAAHVQKQDSLVYDLVQAHFLPLLKSGDVALVYEVGSHMVTLAKGRSQEREWTLAVVQAWLDVLLLGSATSAFPTLLRHIVSLIHTLGGSCLLPVMVKILQGIQTLGNPVERLRSGLLVFASVLDTSVAAKLKDPTGAPRVQTQLEQLYAEPWFVSIWENTDPDPFREELAALLFSQCTHVLLDPNLLESSSRIPVWIETAVELLHLNLGVLSWATQGRAFVHACYISLLDLVCRVHSSPSIRSHRSHPRLKAKLQLVLKELLAVLDSLPHDVHPAALLSLIQFLSLNNSHVDRGKALVTALAYRLHGTPTKTLATLIHTAHANDGWLGLPEHSTPSLPPSPPRTSVVYLQAAMILARRLPILVPLILGLFASLITPKTPKHSPLRSFHALLKNGAPTTSGTRVYPESSLANGHLSGAQILSRSAYPTHPPDASFFSALATAYGCLASEAQQQQQVSTDTAHNDPAPHHSLSETERDPDSSNGSPSAAPASAPPTPGSTPAAMVPVSAPSDPFEVLVSHETFRDTQELLIHIKVINMTPLVVSHLKVQTALSGQLAYAHVNENHVVRLFSDVGPGENVVLSILLDVTGFAENSISVSLQFYSADIKLTERNTTRALERASLHYGLERRSLTVRCQPYRLPLSIFLQPHVLTSHGLSYRHLWDSLGSPHPLHVCSPSLSYPTFVASLEASPFTVASAAFMPTDESFQVVALASTWFGNLVAFAAHGLPDRSSPEGYHLRIEIRASSLQILDVIATDIEDWATLLAGKDARILTQGEGEQSAFLMSQADHDNPDTLATRPVGPSPGEHVSSYADAARSLWESAASSSSRPLAFTGMTSHSSLSTSEGLPLLIPEIASGSESESAKTPPTLLLPTTTTPPTTATAGVPVSAATMMPLQPPPSSSPPLGADWPVAPSL